MYRAWLGFILDWMKLRLAYEAGYRGHERPQSKDGVCKQGSAPVHLQMLARP